MKVGFFVWNPFQIFQFESIVNNLPGASYLLEKRKIDYDRLFPNDFTDAILAPIRRVTRAELATLDGEYDAIVCQTGFTGIENFQKTRLVGMQYSMSKERHQYGPWRALCDLNLVYGQYSFDRISPYSPCVKVGNPRFDRWFEGQLEQTKIDKVRAHLDPGKKTILYLPTWGDLSSLTDFGDAVAGLGKSYNVIAKVHHNTDSIELSRKMTLTESGVQDIFGASDDLLVLLHEADLVLSDYSGAIFDAINVGKPVILLQKDPEALALLAGEKFGLESIEYARRDMIGPAVSSPDLLQEAVDSVFGKVVDYSRENQKLKSECFAMERGCGMAAARAIADFIQSECSRPYYQLYLRDELREQRIAEARAKRATRKNETKTPQLTPQKDPAATDIGQQAADKARLVAKALLAPYQMLIQRRVIAVAEASKRRNTQFELSPLSTGIVNTLPSHQILELARKYDSPDTQAVAVLLSRLAYQKSRSVGLDEYIAVLAKYGCRSQMQDLLQELLDLPVNRRYRVQSRIERIHDYLKEKHEEVLKSREESRAYIVRTLAVKSSRKSNYNRNSLMFTALIDNRWIEQAASLILTGNVTEAVKRRVAGGVARPKERMEQWYFLGEIANSNQRSNLGSGDYLCFFQGKVGSIAGLAPMPVVEFFLPPYFYSGYVTDAEAHRRICHMLRNMISGFVSAAFAIVPRHQFRLTDAAPTGNWPAISYHTTGSQKGWFHLKDGPIPGYFSCDPLGYAGWSSLASEIRTDDLPATEEQIEDTWHRLQKEVVLARKSKYGQTEVEFRRPGRPFIFLPMQILSDAVARLAYIPGLRLLEILVKELPRREYDLVIKRHPKCINPEVAKTIDRLARRDDVHVVNASIHDILPAAAAVVTVNSGVGFEALLYGKRVITTGRSDYSTATVLASTESELQSALNDLGRPVDVLQIKRFMHYYCSQYLFSFSDAAAITARIEMIRADTK
jgi:CDP-glycerol glycerophosphotransferase (TagB/SpsB family)